MTDSKTLRCSAATLNAVKQSLLNGKKIQAIKLLRTEVRCGLREAKIAVERYDYEVLGNSTRGAPNPDAQKITTRCCVSAVTFDLGEGELTVDLEGKEMRALMGLDTMGIEEVSRILDLVKVLKAFSEGEDIYINSVSKTGEEDAAE